MYRKNSPVRDIFITVAIVLGIIAFYYLALIGVSLLLIIGFLTPGWIILLIVILKIVKKYKK